MKQYIAFLAVLCIVCFGIGYFWGSASRSANPTFEEYLELMQSRGWQLELPQDGKKYNEVIFYRQKAGQEPERISGSYNAAGFAGCKLLLFRRGENLLMTISGNGGGTFPFPEYSSWNLNPGKAIKPNEFFVKYAPPMKAGDKSGGYFLNDFNQLAPEETGFFYRVELSTMPIEAASDSNNSSSASITSTQSL